MSSLGEKLVEIRLKTQEILVAQASRFLEGLSGEGSSQFQTGVADFIWVDFEVYLKMSSI